MTTVVAYQPEAFTDLLPARARFALDHEAAPPRLNVCLPHLHREHVFGGMTSALELAAHLAGHYAGLRVIVLNPLPPQAGRIALAPILGRDEAAIETVSLHDDDALVFHPGDILLCPNWRTVLVWERLAGLCAAAGLAPPPFYYFIQDWEPGFYPMGLKHLAAEGTYRHAGHGLPIFNSRELHRFFLARGYPCDKAVVIRPSLDNFLLYLLSNLDFKLPPKRADRVNVLVYGRPGHHRNCFPAVLACLAAYSEVHGRTQGRGVDFYSAGMPHEDVSFANGMTLRSLGTLSMPDYAATLLQSHVGLALMASPHPSYPPLEMACFGLEVLTNAYPGKDLSREHPRIRNIDPTDPVRAAGELARAIDTAVPRVGRQSPAIFPKSLSPLSWPANFQQAGLPVLL